MEITYRPESFPKVRRKVLIRGFSTASIAIFLCGLYFAGVAWYASFLPGICLLVYTFIDIGGLKSIEKGRKDTKIVTSGNGLHIDMGGPNNSIKLSWKQIKLGKVKRKNGRVISFGIKLKNSPITFMEFNEDLTHFDKFWALVNEQTNV